MSFNSDHYVWIPYGNSNDIEYPLDEHAHIDCYVWHEHITKDLIKRTAYIKPYIQNSGV
jgi:hypothetical protein